MEQVPGMPIKVINMSKKNRLHNTIFGIIIIMVLTMPVLGLAQLGPGEPLDTGKSLGPGEPCQTKIDVFLPNPLSSCSFSQLVASIADLAVKIGIPIAVIFIIYSGLLFVTARGSEDKLKTAKTSITWAIIGTAILVGAKIIAEVLEATIKVL